MGFMQNLFQVVAFISAVKLDLFLALYAKFPFAPSFCEFYFNLWCSVKRKYIPCGAERKKNVAQITCNNRKIDRSLSSAERTIPECPLGAFHRTEDGVL